MKNNKILYYVIILFSFLSCIIEDASVSIPKHTPEIVVNAFFNPDSLIKVNLTYTINLDEQNYFEAVDNAEVVVFENNLSLDTLEYIGKGDYMVNHYPTPLSFYQLKITVDGKVITAESTMPYQPNVLVAGLEQIQCRSMNLEYSDSYIVSLDLAATSVDFDYWFGFLESAYDGRCYPDTSAALYCPIFVMHSTDYRLSKFNQQVYPTLSCNNRIINEYALESFVSGILLKEDNAPIGFITSSFKPDDYFVSIVAASDEYTKYYKTVISNLNYEFGKEENPFNTPNKIYNNIAGGVGIFCCYNRIILKIE